MTCLGRLVRALAIAPTPTACDWSGVLDRLPVHPSVSAGLRKIDEPLSTSGQAFLEQRRAKDESMKNQVRATASGDLTRQLLRFPTVAAIPTKNDVLVSIRSFDKSTSVAFCKLAKQHGYTVTELWYAVALIAAIETIDASSSASQPDNLSFEANHPADVRRWIAPELRADECDAITASSVYTPVAAMRKASAALANGELDGLFALCSIQRQYLHLQRTDSRELETIPEYVRALKAPLTL